MSAKESTEKKIKVKRVRGFLFAVLAQWSAPRSSKPVMRVRFPYTARYDSMPVGSSRRGSHDHAGRVRYPRLRLFDGHADIAGAHQPMSG